MRKELDKYKNNKIDNNAEKIQIRQEQLNIIEDKIRLNDSNVLKTLLKLIKEK
ncbi:hypothetical protein MASR1M45_06410 [Candidatus Kapaibacterium sp.]